MTERWVSTAKYFCKYCNIFVADNKSSRTHHESGQKHKYNVDKFMREVRKDDDIKKREAEKTRLMLERIEKAATASYIKDTGKTVTSITASQASSSSSSAPIAKPSIYKPPPSILAAAKGAPPPPRTAVTTPKPPSNTTRVGEWTTVEEPVQKEPAKPVEEEERNYSAQPELVIEYDEDENLRDFKLAEKRIISDVVDDADGGDEAAPTVTTFKRKKKKNA
ncbi:hypothetical protein HDU76_009264 [Blyttiomyces sp. JEL0837]|nr:hypothetical protein HDU76_009264 [Blyttiomyces sp. JEL0837]